ncbi:MAG: hypothetical protein JW912_02955 [Sedimentisphaerales bacterium]|nr:hypothetical protein [Sedimentisphaerales bacterium]
METQAILEEMLELLSQNGVIIRTEAMGGSGGGLCKLKDKRIFYVDSDASAVQTAFLSAQAIGEIVDIENLYLRPQVREFIENSTSKL